MKEVRRDLWGDMLIICHEDEEGAEWGEHTTYDGTEIIHHGFMWNDERIGLWRSKYWRFNRTKDFIYLYYL